MPKSERASKPERVSTIEWGRLRAELPRRATSTAITAGILALAADGTIRPGMTLPPERDLAMQLGVSRTTVREAMHELTLKGVVRRRQGSGTVVLDPPAAASSLLNDLTTADREAAEVTDFRTTFEPQIASLAAVRRTESDLELLSRMCDVDPDALSADSSLDLDQRFHEAIAAATHNHLIVALSRATAGWVRGFRGASHTTPAARATSLAGHRLILAAIEAGDPDQAARAMREHVAVVGRL